MNCIKCGRETGEDQVFCQQCLEEMETYPVKPGTAVHIPPRPIEDEPKKNQPRKKPVLTPSEQVLRLKRKLLRLRILLVLLLLICGGLCFVISRAVMELDFQRLLGQNYHTVEATTETEATQPLVETIAP